MKQYHLDEFCITHNELFVTLYIKEQPINVVEINAEVVGKACEGFD